MSCLHLQVAGELLQRDGPAVIPVDRLERFPQPLQLCRSHVVRTHLRRKNQSTRPKSKSMFDIRTRAHVITSVSPNRSPTGGRLRRSRFKPSEVKSTHLEDEPSEAAEAAELLQRPNQVALR